ncbi:MAG: 3-deoxy-7-phosphoheptulonate synthase [Mycobacteriaceae bacterium]
MATSATPNTSSNQGLAASVLPTPQTLLQELPLSDAQTAFVHSSRDEVAAIVDGIDDRLLVVVGPCSIHDPSAALDYAELLKNTADTHAADLLVVMRTYFEKPRTTTGWKGLINDPHLDQSFDIPQGLRIARELLLNIIDRGLPVGCEFLEPNSAAYLADAVSWGAIGARTTESQVHRQLASGLMMPIGFKNATDGNIHVAVDGAVAARSSHVFLGINTEGVSSVVTTAGNPHCHIILRGGRKGTNYSASDIEEALTLVHQGQLAPLVMIDASHANSNKDHTQQSTVVHSVAQQITHGYKGINGIMLESFLVEGRQEAQSSPLTYGQSITDACINWETTQTLLADLATAVRKRRN